MEKKLVWKIEVRRVEDLVAWSENPRKIKKADMERLMERIKQRGFHAVIVIDIDNTILSGSQRKAALLKLGVTEVNVLIPNRKLSEEERKKIGARAAARRSSRARSPAPPRASSWGCSSRFTSATWTPGATGATRRNTSR